MVNIFKVNISKSPELILLGLKLETIDFKDRTALWYLLTAARIQYTIYKLLETKEDTECGELDNKFKSYYRDGQDNQKIKKPRSARF